MPIYTQATLATINNTSYWNFLKPKVYNLLQGIVHSIWCFLLLFLLQTMIMQINWWNMQGHCTTLPMITGGHMLTPSPMPETSTSRLFTSVHYNLWHLSDTICKRTLLADIKVEIKDVRVIYLTKTNVRRIWGRKLQNLSRIIKYFQLYSPLILGAKCNG